MYKRQVLHEAKKIVIEEHDTPQLLPGQVLIGVRAGGICGSDLSYYFKGKSGDFAMREPLVLGHEVAGEVAALGEGVSELRVGQRVAVNPSINCGTCRFCAKGMPNQCLNMRFMGSASTFPHMQGAFREFIAVSAGQCIPVPDSFDFAQASMAEPLAVVLHALGQAGSLVGARVFIVGCGPIGCILVAAARRAGAHKLTEMCIRDRNGCGALPWPRAWLLWRSRRCDFSRNLLPHPSRCDIRSASPTMSIFRKPRALRFPLTATISPSRLSLIHI